VEGVQIAGDIGDQTVVDLDRDVVPVQGRVQGGGVVAGAGVEQIPLDLGVELGRKGRPKPRHGLPEGLEHGLAIAPVGQGPAPGVPGLVEQGLGPVREGDSGIGQVRIRQDLVDLMGCCSQDPGLRQDA